MFDYALTKQHMLRVGYSQNQSSRSNLGIGGFDLAERAYSNEIARQPAAHAGDRARSARTRSSTRACSCASTQTRPRRSSKRRPSACSTASPAAARRSTGGRNQKDIELSSDLNYVRGIHTMRTGIQLEGRHYRADERVELPGDVSSSRANEISSWAGRATTRGASAIR